MSAVPKALPALASHYLVELENCPRDRLDDVDFVVATVREAVARAGLTLLQQVVHRFEPQGVTAIALLAESHLSVHTWPERRYAAADLLTCGDSAGAHAACEFLIEAFGADRHAVRVLPRGTLSHSARGTSEAEE